MSVVRQFQLVLGAVLILATHAGGSASAQGYGQDHHFASVPGWKIVRSAVYQGCVASATYRDGTVVRFGVDGIINGYFFSLSNARWSGYANARNFELEFQMDGGRNFSGYFHTIMREGYPTFETGEIKVTFLEALARSNGVRVHEGGHRLTSLSLDGSRRALNTVLECQNSRSY